MPQTATPETTVEALLAEAAERLSGETGRREARLLLADLLDWPQTSLIAFPEQLVPADLAERFRARVADRAEGVPIAHLVGYREFYGLKLLITPDVLIPRPETELLVEIAIDHLGTDNALLLDLGTGSGAVAIALAMERPRLRVTAIDRSPAALDVAHRNADRLGAGRIRFLAGDWFEPVEGEHFEMIVANPPYVPETDPHLQQGDVRFEPRGALAAGAKGLNDLERIIEKAPGHLEPGGWLLLEHGYDQGKAVRQLFEKAGFSSIDTFCDLAGKDRVSVGKRSGK
jgi:release factor glutamine methyltransferase